MDTTKLEQMLADGHDSAMLRFGLGKAYFDSGHWQKAQIHLREAIGIQPHYSAAWQLLGQALHAAGLLAEALNVFDRGMVCAEANGDTQAYKIMRVMRKRVLKDQAGKSN